MADAFESPARRVASWLFANPGYKALSLAVAVGAWVYVQGSQSAEGKVRAVVKWELPPRLATTEPLPATLILTVKGTRSATRRAQRADVEVTANLSDAELGDHNVDFASLEVSGLPGNVEVVGFSPSSARFVLDEWAVRKVRVNLQLVGDPAAGYSVVGSELNPTVVELRGPRIVLAELKSVDTRPIDVSQLTADVDQRVDLELPWGIEPASDSEVRAKVDVEPVVETRIFEDVPVVVKGEGWTVNPAVVTITLQGPAGALEDMDVDRVIALAVPPDSPSQAQSDAVWGAKNGARMEIVFPGDPQAVRVTLVRPAVVTVRRKP